MSGSSVCQPEGSEFEFCLASQTNPTTNSLRFWLTERWHGLAGNGQYCGKRLSQALPGLHVGLPKSPRPGLSECASQSLRRGVRFWLTARRFGLQDQGWRFGSYLMGPGTPKWKFRFTRLWSDLDPGGHMSSSSRRALDWAPRALSILYIL